MEEILAVTDAAVKALGKSTHSSGSSHASRNSLNHDRGLTLSYSDSGICKTAQGERNDVLSTGHFHDSDDSTTASDVLIHSTTVDPDERSFNYGMDKNVSSMSKCSKTSIGSENFNTLGMQKVKISAKRLKEIKSPFENDTYLRNSDKEKSAKSVQIRDKKLDCGAGISNGNVRPSGTGHVIKGVDSNDKNLRQFDAEKTLANKKLLSTASPTGSHRSTASEKSQKSVHSGISQKSVNSEKSQKSVRSGISQKSVNSEKSQKSVHSGISQKSVHSERSEKSFNKEMLELHVSDHNVNLAATEQRKSCRSVQDEKLHRNYRSEQFDKQCFDEHYEKLSQVGVKSGKMDEMVRQNGVEYSPSDKGDPPDVIVERHTPKIIFKAERKKLFEENSDSEDTKTEAALLNGSLDLLTQKENNSENALQTSVSSHYSSQPDIVTVPERIVTVTASSFQSTSAMSASDAGSAEVVQEERVPRRLPARFQLLSKAHIQGTALQQGVLDEGAGGINRRKDSPDIRISNYQLSEKQKHVKDSFLRRYEEAGPVKRMVQPKFVNSYQKPSVEKAELNSQTSDTITAAVAASAAVAVTQPFLKAQQDLENKMAQILEKMAELQGAGRVEHSKDSELERVLEKRVSQLTEQRIEHLEKLQESHMQIQAKILSLTRTTPKQRSHSTSPVRSPSPEQRKFPTPNADLAPRRAFSKSTIHKSALPPRTEMGDHRVECSPLDTPNPRARAPKPVAYQSSSSQSLTGANPKSRGIIEEILASAGSPSGKVSVARKQGVSTRENQQTRLQPRSPNVKKAEKLVEELSTLKDQMTDLVSGVQQTSIRSRDEEKQVKPVFARDVTAEELLGPSPLDPYLILQDREPSSPYKYVPNLSPSHFNVPVRNPPGFSEAKQVLQQVGRNKAYLEANLESVLQSCQEVEAFTVLENIYQDRNDQERACIQHKVKDWVSDLRKQVEREVTDDVVMAEIMKKHKPVLPFKAQTSLSTSHYTKSGMKTLPKGPVGSKIDTGLRKDQKPFGSVPGRLTGSDKENKPDSTTTVTSRRPGVKKAGGPLHPEDEQYMTRVYGKAAYQNKRSTLKGDPYLHYQNTPQQKPPRTPLVQEVKGVKVKSAKTQASLGVKQFYFSPASGSYIPVASTVNTAPIPGQLIPMAVPLGGPRVDSGLSVPTTGGPVTSTPVSHPVVTAADNVALVSVPAVEEEEDRYTPELEKQVLPPVNIDTDSSQTSDVGKSGTVHLKSPQHSPAKAKYEVTFHREEDEEESEVDISGEDLPPEEAPGLTLPGYCPPSPPLIQERPEFPPQLPGATKLTQASDLLAEDMRRKDILENKASEWVEQEIMARIISEMYPLRQQTEMPHVDYEESVDSVAEDPNQSLFLMEAIGRDGLQLFVDAGQPVDSSLVNALIREVLLEMVSNMLGQKPGDEAQQGEGAERRGEAKLGATGLDTAKAGISPQDDFQGMVPTPEPTPKASPISSPTRVISPPVTPPESPPGQRIQPQWNQPPAHAELPSPEPESESLDISEELRSLRAKLDVSGQPQSMEEVHDILTPVATPIPEMSEEEQVSVTPPKPSPRQPVKETVIQVSPSIPPPPAVSPSIPPPPEEPKLESPGKENADVGSESPQPWAESPIPQENPDYFENEGTRYPDTQEPYTLTVAPSEEQLGYIPPTEIRQPSSPHVLRKRSLSPSASETESVSIMSSITDTSNMEVSEGQWLLCKSEGELAGFNIDEAAMYRMAEQYKQRPDLSTASTLHSTEDIQDMTAELPLSEGEFQYKPSVAPEHDPVLMLLSKFQSHKVTDIPSTEQYNSPVRGQHGALATGQFDMTSHQVQDLLNFTGRSTGEVNINGIGGMSVKKSMGEVIQVVESRKSLGDADYHEYHPRNAGRFTNRNATGSSSSVSRNESPSRMKDIMRESIQEETEEEESRSVQERPKVTPGGEEQRVATPMTEGRPQSSRGRPSPQRGGPRMSPGGVSLGAGGRTSPRKSAMKRPPQAGRSQGEPERSVTLQSRGLAGRSSDDQGIDSLDYGQSTMSDGQGTRTFTPDQMNMEALMQSGYLALSQSGEFGQSGGSHSLNRDSQDSLMQRNKGKSLGLTYSFEEGGATDTLDESELKHLATTGTLKMNVTIPGLGSLEDDSENVSELDITDGNTM